MPNNPEKQPGVEGGNIDYGQQLTEITNKINALSDENTENSNQARESLQNLLDDEFLNNLDSYLQNNETLRAGFQNTLINFLNNYKGNKEDAAYKSLTKLANKLGLKENGGIWSKESPESGEPAPEKPTINFTGKLKGIEPGEEGKKQKSSEGLYDLLKRDAPAEGENLDDNKNLYKTMQEINTQLINVGELLEDSKLQRDEWLTKIKQGLEGAQTVIDYATPENVRILQKFISDNLTGGDKIAFDKRSKKGDHFDGKFGMGTLKGANIILRKTDEYITNMKQYLEKLNTQENKEKLDQITIKDNPTMVKVENADNIDYKQLLDIPDGVSVEFELSDVDKEKLKTPGTQNITLKVKSGNEEKIFQINVTVVESANQPNQNNNEQVSTNTTPLIMGEGNNQKTYLVMQNSQTLAQNSGLVGVTFYSSLPYSSGEYYSNGQLKLSQTTVELNGGEREYYLKLANRPNKLYKIKVDSCGCICPVATEIFCNLKNRDGSPVERNVLLANNESCKNYLRNKLPDGMGVDAVIGWNDKLQDYTISSYGKTLTIEPMTINNDWVADNLSDSLALLNFTNYLTGMGGIDDVKFINDNPDLKRREKLYVRVKKQDHPQGKRRYPIDSADFCLTGISKKVIKKYIKYNNHEEWEDDWDKKKKNKKYEKITL